MTITEMRRQADGIRSAYKSATADVEEQTQRLTVLHEARKAAETVASIVSDAAQAAQRRFATVVAGVVTQCLNSVYPKNPYEFKLVFRECAGKTVVDTVLYKEGEPLDPLSSTGGGVWDVLAFSLRVSIVVLTATDKTKKFMVFDEPFKYLHGISFIRRAYETLESVRKQFGYTFLVARVHDGEDKKSGAMAKD